MNTGQMLITIGAMMLLSLVILRVNNNFLSTSTVLYESKFGVLAVSLATSIIEEANSKAFDHTTDTNSVTSLTELTPSASLGFETGETYETFNDFDDFNGYHRDTEGDSTIISAAFDIDCAVDYVNASAPDGTTTNRTWHKKITVTVTSRSMQDTVRMSSIYSYWYFR